MHQQLHLEPLNVMYPQDMLFTQPKAFVQPQRYTHYGTSFTFLVPTTMEY